VNCNSASTVPHINKNNNNNNKGGLEALNKVSLRDDSGRTRQEYSWQHEEKDDHSHSQHSHSKLCRQVKWWPYCAVVNCHSSQISKHNNNNNSNNKAIMRRWSTTAQAHCRSLFPAIVDGTIVDNKSPYYLSHKKIMSEETKRTWN
jgi:hypothetical protein